MLWIFLYWYDFISFIHVDQSDSLMDFVSIDKCFIDGIFFQVAEKKKDKGKERMIRPNLGKSEMAEVWLLSFTFFLFAFFLAHT